ncbi:MAG TPA: hypothetical protein VGM77_06535 [Gemmatimonadales bacterium]
MSAFGSRVALSALALMAAAAPRLHAQRDDSFTWSLGVEAGVLGFQTQAQTTTKYIPSVGANFLIMAGRGGLLVGFDEGIGTDENASAVILFNDIRKYQAILMAFPVKGAVQPYFGGGAGIMQIVGPRVDKDLVTDPTAQASLVADAKERGSSGFLTLVGGVQGRAGRVTIFAQYQVTTSPSDDRLMHGATQSLMGGIRLNLGSARDGVSAGGY